MTSKFVSRLTIVGAAIAAVLMTGCTTVQQMPAAAAAPAPAAAQAPVAVQPQGGAPAPAGNVFQKRADPGMMATMQSMYPSTQFREVNTTPVSGVFEVVMGKNTAYVDQSGRYFMFGRLFDMQSQTDLSPARPEPAAETVDINRLNKQDAIKTVKGKGSRTLYVFSDPDCPFCAQLEKSLAVMDDVTIYTFLFPLEGLHPDAKRKANAIWCAADKTAAWNAFWASGALPGTGTCPSPVERNVALAQEFGINGTPTLIAGDGRKLAGAASPDRINAFLNTGTGAK